MSSQCVARDCQNPALGGDSYKTALCVKCKRSISNGAPLYLTCCVCYGSIFVQNKSSGIRMVCGEVCRKQRLSLLDKERYRREHPIKNKQCVWCKKDFTKEQLDTSERSYCSKKCYHLERYDKVKQKKLMDNNNEQ